MQVGKYKGAEEPLTRDGPSDEARASLEGVLTSFREAWLSGVRDSRGAEASDALEDGPYTPERAKALKLVDAIAYADDAQEAARKAVDAVRDEVRFGRGAQDGKSDDLDEILARSAAGEGLPWRSCARRGASRWRGRREPSRRLRGHHRAPHGPHPCAPDEGRRRARRRAPHRLARRERARERPHLAQV